MSDQEKSTQVIGVGCSLMAIGLALIVLTPVLLIAGLVVISLF
jgi:hypothetical protein